MFYTLKYKRFTSVFRVNNNVLYTFRASLLENAGVFTWWQRLSENIFYIDLHYSMSYNIKCYYCGQAVYLHYYNTNLIARHRKTKFPTVCPKIIIPLQTNILNTVIH